MARAVRHQVSPERDAGRIPTFQTVEEEAAFWDSHSTTDFEHEFAPADDVRFVIRRGPLTKTMTVRLDDASFAALDEQARAQGVQPSVLARRWILERLRQADAPLPRPSRA